MLGDDSVSVTVNAEDKKHTFQYSLSGNLTHVKRNEEILKTYTYDTENRLTQVSSLQSPVASYTYDFKGRRIQKNVNGVITNFIYDGDQIILETNSEGATLTRYVYGTGIDEPIRLERGSNICYYHLDGLGSVIDLSNSAGQLVEHYDYDVFGNIKSPLSTIGNRFYFTAREYDEETGLYYYRARYYDPKLGRFLSVDPVGYEDSTNLYQYALNNPVNNIDPTGLKCISKKEILRRILQKLGVLPQIVSAIVNSAETDAFLGALEKLGEREIFSQSRNPATGLPIAGYHLERPFGALGKVAANLAGPLAVIAGASEVNNIWQGEGSALNKALKTDVAISVNVLTYISAGTVVAGTTSSGVGITTTVGAVATIGAAGEYTKSNIFRYIDNRIY